MTNTFTIVCECFRCNGFKRAFSTFTHTNDGRCLRCNGGLRTIITKPIYRLEEFEGSAEKRRADSIATIAKVLSFVGAPVPRDSAGKVVSEWGFAYRMKGDTLAVFVSALTIAPDAVRVRGWSAFCAKARATLGDRAEAVIASTRRRAIAFAGLTEETVDGWLGAEVAVAA